MRIRKTSEERKSGIREDGMRKMSEVVSVLAKCKTLLSSGQYHTYHLICLWSLCIAVIVDAWSVISYGANGIRWSMRTQNKCISHYLC